MLCGGVDGVCWIFTTKIERASHDAAKDASIKYRKKVKL